MKKCILITLTLFTMILMTAKADVADKCFKEMPFGCFVTRSVLIPKAQTDAIGKKLGVPIKKLSNTYLRVQGKSIQVNIIEANSIAGAKKLHKTLSATKNHPAFCLLQDRKVIEFYKEDVSTAIKTAYELGFSPKPKQIEYDLTAHISTVDKADYMRFNELFTVFLQTNTKNPNKESASQIKSLSRGFTFGTSVTLRNLKNKLTIYEFTPKPAEIQEQPHDCISYSFKEIPSVLEIPYVTLNAKIICNDTGVTPTTRKPDESLLSATSYWPVNDPGIKALAKRITAGRDTQEAKVAAILEWLTPGKNIKSDGSTGSRWGVKKVLKQKYGRCWDSSDCFVTLARATGVPTRQVGGWLYGTSGHIWAEVLTEGRGWQQVDPTGGGKLNCGIYHVPYFTTETGEMPILYLSMPQIELIETKL